MSSRRQRWPRLTCWGGSRPHTAAGTVHETVRVQGLLTVEGVRYLFTLFVSNFMECADMGSLRLVAAEVQRPAPERELSTQEGGPG